MSTLGYLLSLVGNVLLAVTAVSALQAWWRTRDTRRLDILLVIGVPFASLLSRRLGRFGVPLWLAESMSSACLAAAPYLLVRLVQHFRDVPLVLRRGTLLFAAIGAALFLLPAAVPPPIGSALTGIAAVLLAAVALMFHRESARSAGITRRRLRFAAAGTWAFAGVLGIWSLTGSSTWLSRATFELSRTLAAMFYICFFVAFSTPQKLRARWLRDEEARYLSATGQLDPEERGRRAAGDLNEAAARSASNAATLVALRPTPDASELVVRAATRPELQKIVLPIDAGVIARAVQDGPTSIPVTACGDPLASVLEEYGSRVLAAPIATPSHTWGVLLVVQRRGSLFPDDDLRLLARLGGFAATALDHAYLVADARARERRAADRRLREVESRMTLMLDSIKDDAMLVLDDRGCVVNWQAGAVHVFGYTADEMTDESAAPLFAATDDQLRAWLTEARQLGLATREGECRRRDGSRFLGATTIRPLETGGEDVQGYVVVARDISERRELEERLRQSQKLEAIGQLAGGVAHDFNNLLLVIAGNAELLIRDVTGGDPAPVDRASLEEIQKAAERAASLTRQLLAFSRTQALQSSAINLPQLITDLLPMLRRVITEHIEVVVRGGDEIRPVLGDRGQLQQVMLNLAVNARDAMPGGGRLTIRTTTEWLDHATLAGEALPGPYVVLEVSDTGIGMDEATRARIFEPFFTTKPVGQGTGLGLATVYGIVKQMAGTIRVASEPGRGTTFRVYFPETRIREAAMSQGPRVAAQLAGTETILLVEDDAAVRAFLKELLEKHGYRVLQAEHQAAALARVQAHADPIHLIITDVVMPGGTGPELVRALAQLRPGVPALYISGYADAVLQQEAAPPKASEFLQKPFSSDDLLVRVRQLVTRQARAQ
jgi:PAS domain S-box-containing protein